MKTRNETDVLEYASGWATLEQELASIMQTFELQVANKAKTTFGSTLPVKLAVHLPSRKTMCSPFRADNLQINQNQLLSKIYRTQSVYIYAMDLHLPKAEFILPRPCLRATGPRRR